MLSSSSSSLLSSSSSSTSSYLKPAIREGWIAERTITRKNPLQRTIWQVYLTPRLNVPKFLCHSVGARWTAKRHLTSFQHSSNKRVLNGLKLWNKQIGCTTIFERLSAPWQKRSHTFSLECENYKTLSQYDRNKNFLNETVLKCDNGLAKDWYRFTGAVGKQMPTQCVPKYHCGTHEAGWFNGNYPAGGGSRDCWADSVLYLSKWLLWMDCFHPCEKVCYFIETEASISRELIWSCTAQSWFHSHRLRAVSQFSLVRAHRLSVRTHVAPDEIAFIQLFNFN